MALNDSDKKEILSLFNVEIKKIFSELQSQPMLDVRSIGRGLGGRKMPPVAADQCCNGCD